MATLLFGDRIGRTGALFLGCSAAVFDPAREKILLTRRTDNGRWCLPGGRMEAGESAAEACAREVREETGLEVRLVRLVGVYSDPHRAVEYADGHRYHVVSLHFEAEAVGGALGLSDETLAAGYFSPDELARLDVMEHHRERIADTLADQAAAFVR